MLVYRLCQTSDPEERLEDAALWKALHDEFGEQITSMGAKGDAPAGAIEFGRSMRFKQHNANPVSIHLPYWTDEAFLANAGRSVQVLPWDATLSAIAHLHANGHGAFVKSTKLKQAVFRIPVGVDPKEEIGEMAYSFVDGGPELIVQELCMIEFEHRFFCIDREVITHSPVQWELTPIDRLRPGTVFRTPRESLPVHSADTFCALLILAERVAKTMREPHAVIDCGMVNGLPGVIEFNPIRLGECGLYACDVRKLAKAARKLIPVLAQASRAPGDRGAGDEEGCGLM